MSTDTRLTSQEAALRGRIGAYQTHATHDSKEITANARKAFHDKFEREVDPERLLSDEERHRRAEMARKLYFARLALKSARARRKIKAERVKATVEA